MPQIFTPACNTLARWTVPVLLLVAVATLAAVSLAHRVDYATLTNMTVPQPVPFSHRHHVGELGIDCRFCHASVATAASAGMPGAGVCMKCHAELWTDADVLEPVRQSWQSGEPLRWTRVYDLPDFVYFDHSVHVAKGVGCSTCHGHIEAMALTQRAVAMEMRWCLDCHREPQARLRPQAAIYDGAWQANGDEVVPTFDVAVEQLTNCTVCHR